jgi:hypothetical protein
MKFQGKPKEGRGVPRKVQRWELRINEETWV